MVNYCAVSGCGRNCANSSHLHFFGLPREKQRLEAWLQAIGRSDILDYPAVKRGKHPNHRVCSRHFAASSIKNKHLCEDAMPTLFLPQGSSGVCEDDNEKDDKEHIDILCNSCQSKIQGVLYKCIVCPNFDMCVKCERFGAHNEHYMLRIPYPTKFRVTNNLVTELQHILAIEDTDRVVKHYTSSDDDIPITEYINNYENSSNLSNNMKNKIKSEVSRVLSLKNIVIESKKAGKRKVAPGKKKDLKRQKETKDDIVESVERPPEVVFAEVMDVTGAIMDVQIKEEIHPTVEGIGEQQITQRISDELSAFILDANQYT